MAPNWALQGGQSAALSRWEGAHWREASLPPAAGRPGAPARRQRATAPQAVASNAATLPAAGGGPRGESAAARRHRHQVRAASSGSVRRRPALACAHTAAASVRAPPAVRVRAHEWPTHCATPTLPQQGPSAPGEQAHQQQRRRPSQQQQWQQQPRPPAGDAAARALSAALKRDTSSARDVLALVEQHLAEFNEVSFRSAAETPRKQA